jgi:superfamily I DNA/RNA helicase
MFGSLWGRQYTPPPAVPKQQTTAPAVQQTAPEDQSIEDLYEQAAAAHTQNAPAMRRLGGGLSVSSEHALGSISRQIKPTVTYSDQQNTVIHCPSKIIVVNAFAGTGKTTTAIGYAAARPNKRMLYIAFNKGIQVEAAARFGSNVECRTTHSLAYTAVGRHYKDRLARPWRTLTLRNEAAIGSIRDAAITQAILNKFFQSSDTEITYMHGVEVGLEFNAEEREIHACAQLARNVWTRMQNRQDKISIPDDAYLKMWALTRPKLDFEHIIFDEAQDSNPVIEQVVRNQSHANLLYIGDRHQSIYAFRGANNAMDGFSDAAKQLHLSQTWRFGPNIAHVANLILGELKGEKVKIEGMGTDAKYVKGATVTKLARTNAQLFKDAAQRQGKGVHWIGGSKSYRIDRLLDAFNLYSNNRSEIKDPIVRQFSSWLEMQQYAEEAKDREIKVLAEVIDEYRKETPILVKAIQDNEVTQAADAEIVLTTAHKAKGLDWDYVSIAEDFEVLAETEADLAVDPSAPIQEQEINLLYVVATRAKKRIQLNEETLAWIEKLPEHRAARELALQKQQRRLSNHPTP